MMPPIFTKKRRWPPSKPVQYVLSGIAAATAVALLIVWLTIGFGEGQGSTNASDNTDDSSVSLPGTSYCLIIIK